MNFIFN